MCAALKPSELDFIQRRGRVLKKMGAFTKAAEAVDSARQLDKADRYMNSKVGWLGNSLGGWVERLEGGWVRWSMDGCFACPIGWLFGRLSGWLVRIVGSVVDSLFVVGRLLDSLVC